jgi:hypothetical protein
MNEQSSLETKSLGPLVTQYRPKRGYSRINRITAFVVGVPGVVLLVAGIVLTFRDRTYLCLPIFGLAGIGAGLLSYRLGQRQRGFSVSIHEQGLSFEQSGLTDIFRWDHIVDIKKNVQRNSRGRVSGLSYTVTADHGRQLSFDHNTIANADELGMHIQRQMTNNQLPEAVSACRAGETLSFGPLEANDEGIVLGDQTLPWEQVGSIELDNQRLIIKETGEQGNWARIDVSRIPNYYLFLSLGTTMSELAKGDGSGED